MVEAMEIQKDFKQTEMGIIPSDWEVLTLVDIGDFKNGINKSKDAFGFGSPFVNLLDVFGKSSIDKSIELGLVDSNDVEKQLYSLKEGDVIFVRSSVKPSGVGLTILVKEDLPDTVFSGFLIRFRDKGKISKEFKEHCFYEEGFRKRLVTNSTVSANTNINQEALKSLLVAFPPTIAEQTAIATALNDTDTLITQLEKLIAKKRNIKQGVMQELLTGKKRLPGFERKKGFKKTEVGVLPEDWKVVCLNDCLALLTDFEANGSFESVANNVQIFDTENFAWYVRATDLENHSDLSKVKYVDKKSYKFLAKTKLYGDEVLITKRGEIGKVYFFKKRTDYATLAPNMYLLKLNEQAVPFYIYSFFKSVGNRLLIEKNASTTLGALYKDDVKAINFPFPPTKVEQQEIAQILSDMDAEIEAFEKKLQKYKMLKQGMMQNLLTGRVRLI